MARKPTGRPRGRPPLAPDSVRAREISTALWRETFKSARSAMMWQRAAAHATADELASLRRAIAAGGRLPEADRLVLERLASAESVPPTPAVVATMAASPPIQSVDTKGRRIYWTPAKLDKKLYPRKRRR